jgi:hypothetical protein
MKKLFIIAILSISCFTVKAQVKFGFKAAPQLGFNRLQSTGDTYEIESNGSSLKLLLGPTFDFPFRDNHYFSTGLFFSSKQAAFQATNVNTNRVEEESYDLQYLQVPLTLKLFTEEIGLDKKIYFQFGTTADFRLQGIISDDNLLNQVDFFDFTALLATGLEYRLGINTRIYAGFYYNRGFLNAVKETNIDEEWRLNNDTLGLELGVTF